MTTNTWDKIGQLVQRRHLDTNGVTLLSSEGFAHEPGGMPSAYTNALGGVTTPLAIPSMACQNSAAMSDGSTNGMACIFLDGRVSWEIQGKWRVLADDV